jgi:purine-binding chemotaxis protein CheW
VALAGRSLGFVVDEVTEVITVPAANIKPPPRITNYIGSEYLIGVCLVGDEMVMLLNPDTLLTRNEARELGGIEEAKDLPAGAPLI